MQLVLPLVRSSSKSAVDILKPSVGSSGTGFSSHLGHFDSLLDTICDERPSKTISLLDDEYDDDDSFALGSSSVLELLKSRHNCHTYVAYRHKRGNTPLVNVNATISSLTLLLFPLFFIFIFLIDMFRP